MIVFTRARHLFRERRILSTVSQNICGIHFNIILSTMPKHSKLLMNERSTWCHFLSYLTYYALSIFRKLICPSSGACDCVDELPHRSCCSQLVVCCRFWCSWFLVVFVLQASACSPVQWQWKVFVAAYLAALSVPIGFAFDAGLTVWRRRPKPSEIVLVFWTNWMLTVMTTDPAVSA